MAIINKTGITDGSTIQAVHVTRAIDALSGGSTDTVVATGSFDGIFTGSFAGDGAGLTGISVTTAATSSFALNAVSSSFSTTSSFALNAGGGAGFPFTGDAQITGSLLVTGSMQVSGSLNVSSEETKIDSPVTINNLAVVNGSLTVPAEHATSFRPPVELLDNNSSGAVVASEYNAGTIFIADRSVGSAAIEFTLSTYDPSVIGQSYKFIFPYSGSGTVKFIDSGNSTLQGVYTDSIYAAKNITSASLLVISDADHCVVDATAAGSDGETWFLRVVTSGTV